MVPAAPEAASAASPPSRSSPSEKAAAKTDMPANISGVARS